jgi:uncharacterized 2Fe-2S/4Fe-4S cluster protein (DUF4445 family)
VTQSHITFLPDDRSAAVGDSASLLDAAIAAGVPLAGVCGGRAICLRCWVVVTDGEVIAPPEARAAGSGEILACMARAVGDVTVQVPEASRIEGEEILTGLERPGELPAAEDRVALGLPRAAERFVSSPLAFALPLDLPQPTLLDPVSDLDRLERELQRGRNIRNLAVSLDVLRAAPGVLRGADWSVTAVIARSPGGYELLDLRPGTDATRAFGLAVDIGTTTVVVHLVDLGSGATLGAAAALNRQVAYGDDVISRIIRAGEPDGLEQLRRAVIGELNVLVGRLAQTHDVRGDEIVTAVIAGNTTMVHLFLGLAPGEIRRAPYVPVVTLPPVQHAEELGLRIHPRATVTAMPGVASYVGGDIVADVLAAGMDTTGELAMLIDAGTNGETVIGNRDFLICCACSAGPAFEGGGISSGMRAARGAIQRVEVTEDGAFACATIGGTPPRGICGSGLVDLLAAMLRAGWIDRSARLRADAPLVRTGPSGPEILVVPAAATAIGRDITVTNADLENLLRSKAAVYAGAALLARRLGVEMTDLERVYVAGGFGTYLDIANAIQIGLLPDVPVERITFIGNGSVIGAKMALLSYEALRQAGDVAARMTYRELSADEAFMDEYVSAMFLPHTDCGRFPRACAALGVA